MMMSVISPIGSVAISSNTSFTPWGNAGKSAQSEASSAQFPRSQISFSSQDGQSSNAVGLSSGAVAGQGDMARQSASGSSGAAGERGKKTGVEELTPQQQDEVRQLQQRDAAVRAHEQAHQSAGAGLTGVVSYTYATGPDGKRYAVGGEVSIDASPVRDNPGQTIQKMEKVIASALAPADPSSQDRAVASEAESMLSSARMELVQQQKYGVTGSRVGTTVDAVA